MKLLFDEGLSPKLVEALGELFPKSESALRNGLAGSGDRRILEYAVQNGFILVTTDSDFEALANAFPSALIVVLKSCNYPTATAIDLLRRNAIRIAAMTPSKQHLLLISP